MNQQVGSNWVVPHSMPQVTQSMSEDWVSCIFSETKYSNYGGGVFKGIFRTLQLVRWTCPPYMFSACAYLNEVFHPAVWVSLNVGLDPDERFHLSVQSVGHQLKLSIWWDEWDGAVVLEPRETHALVEFHILQLYCPRACPLKGAKMSGCVLG